MIPTKPGHVAYLRSRVEEAGGNHDEALRWVLSVDGHLASRRAAPASR
jgi:hypothetical protein